MEKQQQGMVPTMVPTMATPNSDAHKDIPGNPSTAKSSATKLNDRSNGKPLRKQRDKSRGHQENANRWCKVQSPIYFLNAPENEMS
jgi:hypothetical protein